VRKARSGVRASLDQGCALGWIRGVRKDWIRGMRTGWIRGMRTGWIMVVRKAGSGVCGRH